jgi:hypothetical protein
MARPSWRRLVDVLGISIRGRVEFRNHQVRIGHYVTQLRGNPLGLLVAVLLVPVFVGIFLLFAIVAIVGLLLGFIANTVFALFGARRRAPTPQSAPHMDPRSSPPPDGVIDVEVVRRE